MASSTAAGYGQEMRLYAAQLAGARHHAGSPSSVHWLGAAAVAHHRAEGSPSASGAGSARRPGSGRRPPADLAHGVQRQRLVVPSMPRMVALHGADDVVVVIRLSSEAHQAGHHAGRFAVRLAPALPTSRMVVGALGATLHIGHLGSVGHPIRPCRRSGREARHLRARRRQRGLFGAAARHGADCAGQTNTRCRRSPGRPAARRSRFYRPAGHSATSCTSAVAMDAERRGPSGPRAAAPACRRARRPRALTGVEGELHRRHDRAVGLADEWPLAPLGLAAGDPVQHLRALLPHARAPPSSAHVLGGAGHRA